MPSRLLRLALPVVLLLAFATPAARATDAKAADTPTKLRDGVVQIGERAVRLPPGDWTLVHVKDFHPRADARHRRRPPPGSCCCATDASAWRCSCRCRSADMKKERRIPDNPCTARDGVLRGDYSYARTGDGMPGRVRPPRHGADPPAARPAHGQVAREEGRGPDGRRRGGHVLPPRRPDDRPRRVLPARAAPSRATTTPPGGPPPSARPSSRWSSARSPRSPCRPLPAPLPPETPARP